MFGVLNSEYDEIIPSDFFSIYDIDIDVKIVW